MPHLIKSAHFFTGLAFFNPNPESSEVSVKLYSPSGELLGSIESALGAGESSSRLLRELFPNLPDEVTGYAIVESTYPIVTQELIGNLDLNSLSSISPNLLE